METPKRIGIVGLGAMGRPMARHLIAKGFTVAGYDVTPAACERVAALGATIAATPRDLAAQSDAVLIVVGFDAQAERAVFGTNGIREAARPGLIVGMGSTVAPSFARDMARRLEGTGVVLIDMALTRGEPFAEAGTMLVLGGGDEAAFAACRPVLSSFASDIFHLGPFGAGQVGKMVNNLILWACMTANDEGLRLGEALGIDAEKLRHALTHSSAENFSLSARADERPTPWAEKDLRIVMKEAATAGLDLPLTTLVKERIADFKRRKGYPTPSEDD
jgi:3-hydroxyisobutyrate dehydrogenase-like beta-hydroxyacid dehydrogenase